MLRHYMHKKGIWSEEVVKVNLIRSTYKEVVRDNLHAAADFAMDNFFATDGQEYGGGGLVGGDPVGKDGIVVYDATNVLYLTMITIVHPVNPSGDYYRQWRGTLTNDFGGGSINIGIVTGFYSACHMGMNLTDKAFYQYRYASQDFDPVTLATDDILTIDWTISLS